tara:strand:+ start:2632 stop:3321 length:690 start_codon:yes stop_codon:yes gene_type:complete
MGAAVAPAIGTAFGTSAVASMAVAPVFMAAAAAPMAFSTASMMMNTAALSGGGGLLAGVSSAFNSFSNFYNTIKPYTSLISAGTSVLQGIGAYRQGQAMDSQYKMQALQVEAQNEVNKLNWIKDSTDKARRLMAINASALAHGYARGVNGLDGSVKLLTNQNQEEYLRDIQIADFNQQSSNNFASAEAALLRTAASTALSGSKFEALGYLGSAAKLFEETKVPTYGTAT